MEKISIIIPVYNNPQGLTKTLASIDGLEDGHFEVIVVDDASTLSVEGIFDPKRVRFQRLKENSGPGVARNEGVRIATGEILAFTDSDCTVPPDWLSKIRQAMEDSSIVAVAGSYSQEHATNLVSWTRFLEASYHHLREKALVSSFITANFAIRRAVFEEVGGFPKAWFGEDLILGIKLKARGYRVLWMPDLLVGQYFRSAFFAYVKQQFRWSRAVALISARYPQAQSLSWSVKRKLLLPQLILEATLLISPLFLNGAALLYFLVLGLSGLLGLNLAFLIYVSKKRSFLAAAGVLMIVLFGRNLAWLSGCLWALISRPWIMIPGLVKMLFKKEVPKRL